MVNLRPARAYLRSLARRRFTRRTIDVPEVIVTWYGSLGPQNGAMLGDLMAVDNFSADLQRAGVEHAVIRIEGDGIRTSILEAQSRMMALSRDARAQGVAAVQALLC